MYEDNEYNEDKLATMLWWERVRFVYNCVLFPPGVIVAYLYYHNLEVSIEGVAFGCLLFGITANAFYSLAPLLETYASAIGRDLTGYRLPILFLGVGFSLMVMGFQAWGILSDAFH